MNPFEFITAINDSKKNIMDSTNEKNYNAFVVNRSLSYFPETVLYANEMNFQHHIDSKLQFDFLLNIVRKKRRFSKWLKPNEEQSISIIKEYYGYSDEKAKSVLTILSDAQIDEIRLRMYKGGKR